MKNILSGIGLLTLGLWTFVGLLHLFLTVQDKRSPDTMNRLHDMPVIGGFFAPIREETPIDEVLKEADRLRDKLISAREVFDLPAAFSPEDLTALADEVRNEKARLARRITELDEREAQVKEMLREIEQREQEVITKQDALETEARKLKLAQAETVTLQKQIESVRSEAEEQVTKNLAKIYSEIEPERAAALLNGSVRDGDPAGEDLEAITERSARILNTMDPERAAKVFSVMDPIDVVRIQKRMEKLPPKAKPAAAAN